MGWHPPLQRGASTSGVDPADGRKQKWAEAISLDTIGEFALFGSSEKSIRERSRDFETARLEKHKASRGELDAPSLIDLADSEHAGRIFSSLIFFVM